MRSGQELQDLRFGFSTAPQTQRDNWQQSLVSVWDAPPANGPPPPPPFHQHMACCLLDHHHHCRAIVLAHSRSISFCHPPYLQYVPSSPTHCTSPLPFPPTSPPSPPPPHGSQVTATHMAGVRDRAQVLSGAVMARVNGLAAECQGLLFHNADTD